MPTISTVYTDESATAYQAKFRVTMRVTPYDPGCVSATPENDYPPEGLELESVESVELVEFKAYGGETLAGLKAERITLLEDHFRKRLDDDEDLMNAVHEKAMQEYDHNDYDYCEPFDGEEY